VQDGLTDGADESQSAEEGEPTEGGEQTETENTIG